jgi:hypothetical protein
MFDSIFRRKKDEETMREARRLPPGQALTNRFPVLHYGPVPRPCASPGNNSTSSHAAPCKWTCTA